MLENQDHMYPEVPMYWIHIYNFPFFRCHILHRLLKTRQYILLLRLPIKEYILIYEFIVVSFLVKVFYLSEFHPSF